MSKTFCFSSSQQRASIKPRADGIDESRLRLLPSCHISDQQILIYRHAHTASFISIETRSGSCSRPSIPMSSQRPGPPGSSGWPPSRRDTKINQISFLHRSLNKNSPDNKQTKSKADSSASGFQRRKKNERHCFESVVCRLLRVPWHRWKHQRAALNLI